MTHNGHRGGFQFAPQQTLGSSLDHLGAAEQRKWDRQSKPKRLGGLKVDHLLKLFRLHNRLVGRLLDLQNAITTQNRRAM
jgi:hypothetical protein